MVTFEISVVELVSQHLYGLAVQASFYGDVVGTSVRFLDLGLIPSGVRGDKHISPVTFGAQRK